MDSQKHWSPIINELKKHLSAAILKTWFKDITLTEITDTEITLSCANPYAKESIERKYFAELSHAVETVFAKKYDLKITVKQKKPALPRENGPLFAQEPFEKTDTAAEVKNRETQLNPRYTFENFVVGPSNNLAHAASLAIVDNPGRAYNPFFIYGGVGVGKTRLISAVGNSILQKHNTSNILYSTSENFTNELIASFRANSTQDFRRKYRHVDVLIIDDIQFVAGKEHSQEEFFHTFNALYGERKQIILSSDKPPREIKKLEERLCSRFEGGLTIDIQPPDFEMRVAILLGKCEEKHVTIDREIINFIAENVTENIRKLEGALSQIITFSFFNKVQPTVEDAKKILGKTHFSQRTKKISPQSILESVAAFYGLKIVDLKGKRRKAEIVRPRQIIMYLLRTELNMGLQQIGDFLGNRDHTTIIYGIEKIGHTLGKDNIPLKEEVRELKAVLYN